MSQLYVWRSENVSPSEARQRFSQRLAEQTEFYNRHLRAQCTYRYTQCGSVLVGQISSDLGIVGWQPWHEETGFGIAWAGVCEDLLDVGAEDGSLRALATDVISSPHRLSDLRGSFSVCAWDERTGSVAIATGATQHQTLWETSGPQGYAVGSRARPVLDLVGRSAEFDAEEASVFIAYKYLLGKGCLYKHVHRVSSRRQVLLARDHAPTNRIYQTLGEYLGEPDAMSFTDSVELCAATLRDRVARQARASADLALHLTGGRDSRCIAAALQHTDFRGHASTAGPPTSSDVVLAARVAETLGFAHEQHAGVTTVELLARLGRHRDRAKLWTKLSEGMETIRHGLFHSVFFETAAPYAPSEVIAFNGHHAGLEKKEVRDFTRERINRNVGAHLTRHDAVRERFDDMRQSIDAELAALGVPESRWPEMYYWQVDALQWGQDNLLVKDLFALYWTPLFDKTLIRHGWHLPEAKRRSTEFVEGITVHLAPALASMPYQIEAPRRSLPARLISLGLKKGRSLVGRQQPLSSRAHGTERALWATVLLNDEHAQWKELITPTFVKESIEGKHPGETHWNAATIQLFIESCA